MAKMQYAMVREGLLGLATVPPSKRTIRFAGNRYFLSFPTILFRLEYAKDNSQFYLRTAATAFAYETPTPATQLFFPPLPNIWSGHSHLVPGYTCLGDSVGNVGYETPDRLAAGIVSLFFQSAFTTNGDIYRNQRLAGFDSLFLWRAQTKTDPAVTVPHELRSPMALTLRQWLQWESSGPGDMYE